MHAIYAAGRAVVSAGARAAHKNPLNCAKRLHFAAAIRKTGGEEGAAGVADCMQNDCIRAAAGGQPLRRGFPERAFPNTSPVDGATVPFMSVPICRRA